MRCPLDCWKYFFSNRVVNRWNMLDQQIVGATSLNTFKNRLDKLRKTKMGFFMDCSACNAMYRATNNLLLYYTRNTFCGTWYLPHSQVHNDRTACPMAGCIAHARNGHISTSALKFDVIIVFLDPDFL